MFVADMFLLLGTAANSLDSISGNSDVHEKIDR